MQRQTDDFSHYDHLAWQYPYYMKHGERQLFGQISSALLSMPEENRQIDPVGIAEIVNRGFLLAERTLVTGVCRTPWMARPKSRGGWEFAQVPDHGMAHPELNDHLKRLKQAFLEEALSYVEGRHCVGLLLSGGLDSRIVAGVLRELQLRGDYSGTVVALTWGTDECRDVVYAREIARRLGWDWQHLPLTPERLMDNVRIAGEMGAEFSPIHLHAMPDVAKISGLDAVLAGSYGDSVGRAEFSGVRVRKLRPIVPKRLDPFALLKAEVVRTVEADIHHDCCDYRRHIHRESEYQYREIEQQMHYMRRRNQSPMLYINERVPLFQFFTAPGTFGLMWSLDPAIRDDRFYRALLPTLPGGIGEIPWARTGVPMSDGSHKPDQLSKLHHCYGKWLRNEIRFLILSSVKSDAIARLGIFNDWNLTRTIELWSRAKTVSASGIDEIMAWLASLAYFVDRYQIQPQKREHFRESPPLRNYLGSMRASAYLAARDWLRH